MSNNIYAFVIQNKKGENMLAIPNNRYRIDQALYLADRVYDKILVQFRLNQNVDRHFVIDHNTAGIIYITDQFIFHLFINSSHISVGYDLIKRLVFSFNATKVTDAANLEKRFFEVYFMLNSSLYQRFIDHRSFNFNTKNIYAKPLIEDKICDKELIKIRFNSMTSSSKIMEEREAIAVIPYKYAKKNYNQTKVTQFLQTLSDKIAIPTSTVFQNNHQYSHKEMIRNKMYQYAFQMKIKSNVQQNECSRTNYPLNRNNIKNIQNIKTNIQSFSSQQMQQLQQKYGNQINQQIIQDNIDIKVNEKHIKGSGHHQNGGLASKVKKIDFKSPNKHNKEANLSPRNQEQPVQGSKGSNPSLPTPFNYQANNNNEIVDQFNNQANNKENDQIHPSQQLSDQLFSQAQTQLQQQATGNNNPKFSQQLYQHEDLIDFDFNIKLKDENGDQQNNNYENNNQQIEYFSNQQTNNFNHFQNQQQQQAIDLI